MMFEPFSNRAAASSAAAILALCLVGSGAAGALTTDREKPIEIEADSWERDDKARTNIYRGDVIIVQGTLRITGAEVTVFSNAEGDVEKMITLGKPARFRQLPDGEQDVEKNYQKAVASRMEYFKDKDLIVLLGDAVYGQGGDRVAADRIEYDSKNSRMLAKSIKQTVEPKKKDGNRTKRGRVRMTIQPKN